MNLHLTMRVSLKKLLGIKNSISLSPPCKKKKKKKLHLEAITDFLFHSNFYEIEIKQYLYIESRMNFKKNKNPFALLKLLLALRKRASHFCPHIYLRKKKKCQ